MEGRDERGAVAVLGVAVMGVLLMIGVAVLDIAAVVSARTSAQTAADAAALAAAPATFTLVSSPEEAATRMAEANGARLVWCRCRVDRRPKVRTVTVETAVVARLWLWEEVTVFARSRAEFVPYSGSE
ncbi:MAG: pilus assembly protein TadG-related protein [bacterium]|nr:pilus assembly protein TadG-related protein [bacterium]MDE0601410.1 pilus assembly protein TadG-related protein [bacterium]